MATLKQIKTKADSRLTEFWQALVMKQDAYFAKHGKYFQLLVTSPVVDGEDTTFVVRKADDEHHLVDVDFEFNSPIPFQIEVTQWEGSDHLARSQFGYKAKVQVTVLNGTEYKRVHASDGRDSGWSKVLTDIE